MEPLRPLSGRERLLLGNDRKAKARLQVRELRDLGSGELTIDLLGISFEKTPDLDFFDSQVGQTGKSVSKIAEEGEEAIAVVGECDRGILPRSAVTIELRPAIALASERALAMVASDSKVGEDCPQPVEIEVSTGQVDGVLVHQTHNRVQPTATAFFAGFKSV